MNNFIALDSRNRRNILAHGMNAFSPPFYKNYSTDAGDLKAFDNMYINTVHLIPDPMKMNLADSVGSLNDKELKAKLAADMKGFVNSGTEKKPSGAKSDYYPSLGGIASFFSGVFSVMGAMFQKRANSPAQYYDCFEQGYDERHQRTPSPGAWRRAKREDQNKTGRADAEALADEIYSELATDMSAGLQSIAGHCEDKLQRVRLLLAGGAAPRARPPPPARPARPARPRRAFHEAGSVEELFEDAFAPEDFISLADDTFLEYCSPFSFHHDDLHDTDSPRVKIEVDSPKKTVPVEESMEIVQTLPQKESVESNTNTEDSIQDSETRRQVVSACEDKVSKLKALLQGRQQQKAKLEIDTSLPTNNVMETSQSISNTIPISNKTESEKQNCSDVIFSKEIEIPITPSSPHILDPCSYFDEVTGRFYSSSADSEDSFQIVFSDSPKHGRKRIPSDCESEDSFIVFDETADSCYTSNDVFCDDTNDISNLNSDCDDSDSDCESELDSGVTVTLSNTLSRTFGDLTDGSLYEESESQDVVDCAFRSGSELPKELVTVQDAVEHSERSKGGLLLDEAKKKERKNQPAKKVHFSPQPPKVHVMRVWAFAARQARAGHWERHALDRERFRRRIADVEVAVSWVLRPQHRSRVMFQRFMPWWNAQKRQELAERKQREEEEKMMKQKEEADKLLKEKDLAKRVDIEEQGAKGVDTGEGAERVETKEERASTIDSEEDGTEMVGTEDGADRVATEEKGLVRVNTDGEGAEIVESKEERAKGVDTEEKGAERVEMDKRLRGDIGESAKVNDKTDELTPTAVAKQLTNGHVEVNCTVDNVNDSVNPKNSLEVSHTTDKIAVDMKKIVKYNDRCLKVGLGMGTVCNGVIDKLCIVDSVVDEAIVTDCDKVVDSAFINHVYRI